MRQQDTLGKMLQEMQSSLLIWLLGKSERTSGVFTA
jgi:hypothetical protein